MTVKKLFFLDGGSLTLDKSVFVYRTGEGTKIETPVTATLIETNEGYILFDTGLNPLGLDNPDEVWGNRAAISTFDKSYDIRSRLKELSIKPEDIAYVVNSHLHWDHTGGNQFFTDATFIVQKAEYRNALYPDSILAPGYISNHFDHPLNYQLIEGDRQIVEGVSVITTYGHTPGHQSLLVDLPRTGKVILAGDAIFTWENIERDVHAGNAWNPVMAMDSHYRLKHLAERDNAKLFLTHDPTFWEKTKKSPDFYD